MKKVISALCIALLMSTPVFASKDCGSCAPKKSCETSCNTGCDVKGKKSKKAKRTKKDKKANGKSTAKKATAPAAVAPKAVAPVAPAAPRPAAAPVAKVAQEKAMTVAKQVTPAVKKAA